MNNLGVLKARFDKLNQRRSSLLNRKRRCAKVTIPYLLTEDGVDENTQIETTYQGLGARAVNNLAAKLLLSLFPPNTPFYRLDVDPAIAEELKAELGDKEFKTKIEQQLRKVELRIIKYLETKSTRNQLFKALRLLIVTGDCLLEFPKEGGIKVFRVDKYVVVRNPAGESIETVLQEMLSPEEVPEQHKQDQNKSDEKNVELYTQAVLKDDKWYVKQEIFGQIVEGSEGTYPKDQGPLLPLTWSLCDNENYGRSQVEEHLGDFISLEALSKNVLECAAACAKLIFMVNPNGTTNIKDLEKVPNGGFVTGSRDDVSTLQADKFADLRIAVERCNKIEERISQAFLLHSSIQRNAERVTAEEIRYLASELEDALGGIYSTLAQELQMPMVVRVMKQMVNNKKLVNLPKEVQPTIITGFEALGRGHDIAKLKAFLGDLAPLGNEIIATYLKPSNYISRIAIGYGIDTDGLINTEEEVAQMQQQNAQKQMVEKLGPQVISAMKGMNNE